MVIASGDGRLAGSVSVGVGVSADPSVGASVLVAAVLRVGGDLSMSSGSGSTGGAVHVSGGNGAVSNVGAVFIDGGVSAGSGAGGAISMAGGKGRWVPMLEDLYQLKVAHLLVIKVDMY